MLELCESGANLKKTSFLLLLVTCSVLESLLIPLSSKTRSLTARAETKQRSALCNCHPTHKMKTAKRRKNEKTHVELGSKNVRKADDNIPFAATIVRKVRFELFAGFSVC